MTKITQRILSNLDHKQVKLCHEIYIDEGMLELLKELWRCEVLTEYSCQGDIPQDQRAYILFPKTINGLWFAMYLADFGFTSRLSKRELIYGGGLAVDFSPLAISIIAFKLKTMCWQRINLSVINCEAQYRDMAAKVPYFGDSLYWPQ